MKKILYSFLVMLMFAGCEQDGLQSAQLVDGSYSGTFHREITWTESAVAHVTLTFEDHRWTGSGDIEKYPALCHGSYSIVGDTIIFENECVWTAEFNHTLVLSGKYRLTKRGTSLELSRDYGSATTDAYTEWYLLDKQN